MILKLRNTMKTIKSHKILHKIGKQWVVISISILILLGIPALSQRPVHAKQTIKPIRVTRQANQIHNRILNHTVQNQNKFKANHIITLSKKSNINNNHYPLPKTVKPWHDQGHHGMKLMGQRNYGHVKASYYHSSDLRNPGNLLEISGHGLLKESYLLSNKSPKNMRESGNNDLKHSILLHDIWRLKVDHGIYINNSPQSFIGLDPNPHILHFVTMDLSGLNTKEVKNFSFMFSPVVKLRWLPKSERHNKLLRAKMYNSIYGVYAHQNYKQRQNTNYDMLDSDDTQPNPFLKRLNKLNISNFDTRQASDETGMFYGYMTKLTNLVIGKHFSLKPRHQRIVISYTIPPDYSDGTDEPYFLSNVTVPAHFNLFKNYDKSYRKSKWLLRDTTPIILSSPIIRNQNRRTVDRRTHRTYKSELRNGTEPAGTYYIGMNKKEYIRYKNIVNKSLIEFNLLSRANKHSNYYLSSRSISKYKKLWKAFSDIMEVRSSRVIKPLIPTNSDKYLDANLFDKKILHQSVTDLSDRLIEPVSNTMYQGYNDIRETYGKGGKGKPLYELENPINLNEINNPQYKLGWIISYTLQTPSMKSIKQAKSKFDYVKKLIQNNSDVINKKIIKIDNRPMFFTSKYKM